MVVEFHEGHKAGTIGGSEDRIEIMFRSRGERGVISVFIAGLEIEEIG